MKKIRMVANIPNPMDGTSFYRSGGILPQLMSIMPELEITPNPATYDWFVFGFCDVLFMQRPYLDQHVQIAEMARSICVPIWIDYDDDLFSVPRSNPAHKVYSKVENQRNIAKLLAMADTVSVSTHQLKHKYAKLNPDIRVIPNALNDFMLTSRPEIEPKKMVVNWRGSPTHEKDVAMYSHAIVDLAQKFPEWKWNFIGHSFWGLIDAMPKGSVVECPAVDPILYWHLIGQLQPGLQIVPLEDNIFNRSKSNIAWQEAAYSGCGSLCPDWEEWRNPGALLYKNAGEFYSKLHDVLALKTNITELGLEAWSGVQEKYLLSNVNLQRKELLHQITAQKKPFVHSPLVACSPRQPQPSSESLPIKPPLPEASAEPSVSTESLPALTTSTATPDSVPTSHPRPQPIDLMPSYN